MDEIVTAEDVLRVIERMQGYVLGSLWIDRRNVWRRTDEGELWSVCTVGSECWQSYHAAELACRVLAEAMGAPVRLPLQELGSGKHAR